MLRRMALWTTVGAVTLLTTVAIGQPAQDASTTTSGTTTTAKPVFGTSPTTSSAASDAGVPLSTTGTYVPTSQTANTAAKAGDVDAATYAVRLRDLEQRINELKEQIFRSKARLSLLAETVLQGVVAGSQTVIVHENKMSGSYK